jgi:hypothetical protein
MRTSRANTLVHLLDQFETLKQAFSFGNQGVPTPEDGCRPEA